MPLKLLVTSNLFPSPWDPGRSTFNRQQFEHLGRLCDVTVLGAVDFRDSLRRPGPPPAFAHLDARWFRFWHLPGIGRAWQPQCWSASLRLAQGRWVQRQRFDCVMACWAYPDVVAAESLARRLGVPLVAKVHGSDINALPAHGARRERVARTLAGAGAVVAVSQALAGRVASLGVPEARIHVLYNGVDHQRFQPADKLEARRRMGLPADAPLVLYVGNLKASKGCLDLLEAWPGLLAARPDARLLMLGDGPDRAAIARRAEAADMGGSVQRPGAVAHRDLPDWFRAADLLCLPSHNEGVPNVVLEAMASGLPVVATRVGGIPEVVPPLAGQLVPRGDRAALTAALTQTLSRSWDTVAIVEHSRRFDWTVNAGQLHAIVQSVVEAASGPGAGPRHGRG